MNVEGNASTPGSSGVVASDVDCDLAVTVAVVDYVGCGVDDPDTVVAAAVVDLHCYAQEH